MPTSRWLFLAVLLADCDRPAAPTTSPEPTSPTSPTPEPEPRKEPPKKELPPPTAGRVPISQPSVAGSVRVTVKKVTIGMVPMREADGSIRYSDEPRLDGRPADREPQRPPGL